MADQADNKEGGATNGENGRNDQTDGGREQEKPKAKRNPIVIGIVVVVIILAVIYGAKTLAFNRSHTSTDDAYVVGDLVTVSPSIGGTLVELSVREGDIVRKGQLIGRLDPAGPQATLRQAQANYRAAMSLIPEAERNLEYQREATEANIKKAQAALTAQQSRTSGAALQVSLTSATQRNQVNQAEAQLSASRAQELQLQAQIQTAIAGRENFRQAVSTAQAALANYQEQVRTARQAVKAAQDRASSARALADRAVRDEARLRTLYDQDAVSAQSYDSARSQAQSLSDQAHAAQSDVDQAQSRVESAIQAVAQAQSQVKQAQRSVDQAGAQETAARRAADASSQQVKVAQAGVGLALANGTQVGIQQTNLASTNAQTGENRADVATAEAGNAQIAVRRSQIETYRAQAQQAYAALTNAQISFGDTYIYAPNDGEVVRKDANPGQQVTAGTSLVTITKGRNVWIDANFKETQLTDVRAGQNAEIDVDAFPGKTFKGRVQSIREATGATTALLPPDNSTGNFTKVVQRIAVRIELIPSSGDEKFGSAADIANLRQGMSVTATIDTSEKGDAQVSRSDGETPAAANGSTTSPTPGTSNPSGSIPSATAGDSMGNSEGNPSAPSGIMSAPRGSSNNSNGTASTGLNPSIEGNSSISPSANSQNSALPNPGTPELSSPGSGQSRLSPTDGNPPNGPSSTAQANPGTSRPGVVVAPAGQGSGQ